MSNNKAFWRAWLEGSPEKNEQMQVSPEAVSKTSDSLEEGLRELSWVDSGRAAVKRFRKKTEQSIAEEIGNSVTHGVMALFMLCMLPFAAIRAYTQAAPGKEILDAFGVSVFVISIFSSSLGRKQ